MAHQRTHVLTAISETHQARVTRCNGSHCTNHGPCALCLAGVPQRPLLPRPKVRVKAQSCRHLCAQARRQCGVDAAVCQCSQSKRTPRLDNTGVHRRNRTSRSPTCEAGSNCHRRSLCVWNVPVARSSLGRTTAIAITDTIHSTTSLVPSASTRNGVTQSNSGMECCDCPSTARINDSLERQPSPNASVFD